MSPDPEAVIVKSLTVIELLIKGKLRTLQIGAGVVVLLDVVDVVVDVVVVVPTTEEQ